MINNQTKGSIPHLTETMELEQSETKKDCEKDIRKSPPDPHTGSSESNSHHGYTCVRLGVADTSRNSNRSKKCGAFNYQIVKQWNYPKLPMMETLQSLLKFTLRTNDVFECEINWADHTGLTILMFACFHPNNITMVQELLVHGANPMAMDELGRSALHIATQKGRLEVMKLLVLSAGVSVNIRKSNRSWTPLLSAVANQRRDSIKVLVALASATKTSIQ